VSRASDSGFSLVEILVVLAIIAAGAAITLTAIGGRDRRTADFAAQLARNIDLAADRAVVTRTPAALELSDGGYALGADRERIEAPAGLRLIPARARLAIDPAGGAPGFQITVEDAP
jgi:prepilin-type N-terminal cleavage/methylation domain-containing protein